MRRPTDDRGSALFLFPAGVLAVLVLAAIAVDLGAAHLAHREALDAATAAADDAVAAAVDLDRYRSGDGWELHPGRVEALARDTIRRRGLEPRLERLAVSTAAGEVTVTVELRVIPVFAGAVPGGGVRTVEATGTASIERR